MKQLLLPALFILSLSSQAQYQFRFQIDVAALRKHLSNAGDNAAGNLQVAPQITPNGGFTFSWLNTQKSGFQGMQVGLGYLYYKQTTNGQSNIAIDPLRPATNTSSQLHYISLPVEARFGLAQRGRFTPFATVGLFVSRLLSYTEYSHTRLYEPSSGEDFHRYATFNNKKVKVYSDYRDILVDQTDTKIKKGIYEPWNFGMMASVGADFNFGRRHFLSVRVPLRYSPSDVEVKEIMSYQQGERPLYNFPGQSYWVYNTPKGLYDHNAGLYNFLGPIQPSNNIPQRGATYVFSYGLELSYGFKFIPKKRY